MAKFQSPLLGYNNNVRHKNRVFHIQTEDSGVNHPHIITHLFMDGGRILKSVKKSYAEHVGVDGMSETVRGLMKEQHKAMFIALRDGQFDHLVDGGAPKPAAAPAVAAAPAPAPAPAVLAAVAAGAPVSPGAPVATISATDVPAISAGAPATNPDPPRADVEVHSDVVAIAIDVDVDVDVPVHAADVAADLGPATIDDAKRPAGASVPPPASAAQEKASLPAPTAPIPAPPQAHASPRLLLADADAEDVPMTTRQPPEARPDAAVASANTGAPGLTLDFDALERAAQDGASASLFHSTDLPPPPKNLFNKEPGTGGAYRAVEADPRHDAREQASARIDPREEPGSLRGGPRAVPPPAPPPPPARDDKSPQPPRAGSVRAPAGRPAEARYAPARPAAIFGSTQRPPPASIFSDELVSDKSLDEVILSYLAEDLEPPRRK